MNHAQSRHEPDQKPNNNNEAGPSGEQAPRQYDPVCGMDVDLESTTVERIDRKGISYYFCSADCRRQFEANPEEFAA